MLKMSVLICAVYMTFCIASSESKPHGGRWSGYQQSHKGNWGSYHHGTGTYNHNIHKHNGDGYFSSQNEEGFRTQYKRPFGGHRPNWHTHGGECEDDGFGYEKSVDNDNDVNETSDEDVNINAGGESFNTGKNSDENVNNKTDEEQIDTGNTSEKKANGNSGDKNVNTEKTSDDVDINNGEEKIDTEIISGKDTNNNVGGKNIDGPKTEATSARTNDVESTTTGLDETTEEKFKIDIRFAVSNDDK